MSVLDGTESAYAVGTYINTNTCGGKKTIKMKLYQYQYIQYDTIPASLKYS